MVGISLAAGLAVATAMDGASCPLIRRGAGQRLVSKARPIPWLTRAQLLVFPSLVRQPLRQTDKNHPGPPWSIWPTADEMRHASDRVPLERRLGQLHAESRLLAQNDAAGLDRGRLGEERLPPPHVLEDQRVRGRGQQMRGRLGEQV